MACNTRTSDSETSTTTTTTTSLLPQITYFFVASNSVGTIYRSYYRGDYTLLSFVVFAYSALLLLDLCFRKFQKLPPHEKSPQKSFLKFSIWFLYSAIMFGFVHQFAPLFRQRAAGVLIYAVATLCSASLFYVYVVWDEASGCDECRRVEEMRMLSDCAKIGRFDSVLEKV